VQDLQGNLLIEPPCESGLVGDDHAVVAVLRMRPAKFDHLLVQPQNESTKGAVWAVRLIVGQLLGWLPTLDVAIRSEAWAEFSGTDSCLDGYRQSAHGKGTYTATLMATKGCE